MRFRALRSSFLAPLVLTFVAQGCLLSEPIQVDTGRGDRDAEDTGTVDTGNADTGIVDTGTVDTRACPAGYVRIAPGTFRMGSPDAEEGRQDDETQHNVTITRAFCMKTTEVTQGEWQADMGDNPSAFPGCGPNCPVEQVSWDDAVAYANALSRREGLPECYTGSAFSGLDCGGYRLPTESEWEYAARAGATAATYGPLDAVGWYAGNSGGSTQAVGGKAANRFGLYDMLGNVWEWTSDWYDSYPGTVTDPTVRARGSTRVARGGSWSIYAFLARSANRYVYAPGDRNSSLGFRLSRTAP